MWVASLLSRHHKKYRNSFAKRTFLSLLCSSVGSCPCFLKSEVKMFLLYLAQEFLRSALKWWERLNGRMCGSNLIEERRACLRFRFRETITSVWLDGSRTTISQREIRMYSNIRNSSKVPQKKPLKLHERGCFPTKMRLSRMDCATTTAVLKVGLIFSRVVEGGPLGHFLTGCHQLKEGRP